MHMVFVYELLTPLISQVLLALPDAHFDSAWVIPVRRLSLHKQQVRLLEVNPLLPEVAEKLTYNREFEFDREDYPMVLESVRFPFGNYLFDRVVH